MDDHLPTPGSDMPGLNRRQFLFGASGVVVAASLERRSWLRVAKPAENRKLSPLVLSSDLFASPNPQRFIFAVALGPRFASFENAAVAFSPPGKSEGVVQETLLLKDGLPRGRGIYFVDAVFDRPGFWNALLLTRGKKVPFSIDVKEQPDAPTVGSPAPRGPSPTVANALDVSPICTRVPACPLHDTSLETLIGSGVPTAVMFATPALCQSAYCGPVLDELLKVSAAYDDRVNFHHVEIYRSNRGNQRSPTVAAWNLPSEPWLYTIDGDGVIRGRLDGAFGLEEVVSKLDALVAPKESS